MVLQAKLRESLAREQKLKLLLEQSQSNVHKLEEKVEQYREEFEVLKMTVETITRPPLNPQDFQSEEEVHFAFPNQANIFNAENRLFEK